MTTQALVENAYFRISPKNQSPAEATGEIQLAIDKASESGGGTVMLSGGCFVVRTIELKSGVRLQIDSSAVLKADPDLESYPVLGDGRRHLITAHNADAFQATWNGQAVPVSVPVDGVAVVTLPCSERQGTLAIRTQVEK